MFAYFKGIERREIGPHFKPIIMLNVFDEKDYVMGESRNHV